MLEQKLEEILSEVLPKLIQTKTISMLENGKVDRQKLLKKFKESLKCKNFLFGPEDFIGLGVHDQHKARIMLEIVASVLQNPDRKPTLEDRFFDNALEGIQ